MKKTLQGTLLLTTLFIGTQVHAQALSSSSAKDWSIGVGSYGFSIANDSSSNEDFNFSGFNLTAGYAVNNHLQFRATYFLLENDEFSQVESNGFDLMLYGGTGLSEPGFRGYGGAGYYSDKWSAASESDTSSGFQLGGGLGYNWGSVALDFVLSGRQVDKYEDFLYESGTYVAISGNLTISYLF